VRFTGVEVVVAAGFVPFRALAHRFFCARLICLRADADNVRCPFELGLPKAASAAVNRWTSCCALFSSLLKWPTTPDKFPMVPPRLEIVIDGLRFLGHRIGCCHGDWLLGGVESAAFCDYVAKSSERVCDLTEGASQTPTLIRGLRGLPLTA
jgi:hypothetical protein